MMIALEIHHIPPHEFRKIGSLDWKFTQMLSVAFNNKRKDINTMETERLKMESEIEMRMGGL